MTNVHSVHKNKAFAPPAPEKDENDENGKNGACHACTGPVCRKPCFRVVKTQEDVNGEKLTVKKYGGILVPIFSRFTQSFSRFMQSFSRFIRDINGEKTKMIFFTVSFSRFTPSRKTVFLENGVLSPTENRWF